ncbi:MAG: ankyrin repeat domain-containing protein, partial [Desulfobacteraceae bacterium]|nr:ankyrin repeat domain-containing protein [Desulfobacteraceae bacterium]
YITDTDTFPLLEASICENPEIVKLLIDKGADINLSNRSKTTALMGAVAMGHPKVAKYLIQQNADLSLTNHLDYTALHIAVDRGNEALIDLLMNTGNPDTYAGDKSVSLLIPAIKNNDIRTLNYLLKKGVTPDAIGDGSLPPLVAAAESVNFEIIELLLTYHANILAKNDDGKDALSIIGWMDDASIIELIYSKIDPDFFDAESVRLNKETRTKTGFVTLLRVLKKAGYSKKPTPLDETFDFSFLQTDATEEKVLIIADQLEKDIFRIIDLLLRNGADPNTVDKKKSSICVLISEQQDQNILQLFNNDIIKLEPDEKNRLEITIRCANNIHRALTDFFLQATNINLPDQSGNTPLMVYCAKGNLEMASFLIQNGAIVNIANKDGWTPLINAASGEYLKISKFLLQNGANVNAANNYGETALLKAVYRDNLPLAELLRQYDADFTITSKSGDSPISVAQKKGYTNMIELFNK